MSTWIVATRFGWLQFFYYLVSAVAGFLFCSEGKQIFYPNQSFFFFWLFQAYPDNI